MTPVLHDGSTLRLIAALALLVAATGGYANRAPFTEDFSDAGAWRTNSAAAKVGVIERPRAGSPRGLEWKLLRVQPVVYSLERALPQPLDATYTITFWVRPSHPLPLEVQLAAADNARLYQIVRLGRAEWQQVSVDVASMGRFGGFGDEQLAGPLALRFWIDGNPDWAGGGVPRDTEISLLFADISVSSALAGLPQTINARLTVRPREVTGRINPHIYGHFLEHIYHSVEDGLFGELVRNRAFVGPQGFRMQGDTLVQSSLGADIKTFAGDPAWSDYEFTLRARKTGGQEGFLILFRASSDRDFYWWNLGGWGNDHHALEVEVNDGRRVAGGEERGRIEQDRWYEIRVRVEGDHLQGWLDGEKLLDLRDATHPRGGVGVGTWATAAEFRDFHVTDLAGKALPVDFPAGISLALVAEAWECSPAEAGDAVTFVPDETSPNTGIVARIALSDRWTGLLQQRFNAVEGHRYRGVAWVRANGEVADTRVAFVAPDGTTLAADRLGGVTGEWAEAGFTLAPGRTDENASLVISAKGTGSLLIDMVSLMRDDSVGSGCRADLLQAVKALQPPIIRWPGGCFASIFHWKNTLGAQRERKPFYNSPWGEWDSGGFGTDEFIRLCREVGAEPLIVLNLGSWDTPDKWEQYLQDALDWVEYCNGDASTPMGKLRAANGHPEPYNVTHWELDNETWGMGLEAYAERLIPFAKAIRERWPNVRLYACTFWEQGDPKLLELAGQYFDVISYHLYEGPDNFGPGPLRFESIWSRYPDFIKASPNPDATLAITEWNAQSTDWRTGLFAGGLLNAMERLDVIEMGSPALFLRRVDARAWDNAFINHDHRGWFPAPNYVVMKLYREHYQPTRVGLDAAGPLNAVATVSGDGKTLVLKVVNPSPETATCLIDVDRSFPVGSGRQWVVRADLGDRNTLEDRDRIAAAKSAVPAADGSFVHEFPPYSVTVMELAG